MGPVTRASALLDPDDVMRERAISLKHSRSGHLGALTTIQREIEALLTNPDNVTLVRDKLDRYETLWNGFVDSHNNFIEVASDEERAQASEQYNELSQQRINLSATDSQVMQDLQKISPDIRNSKVHARAHQAALKVLLALKHKHGEWRQ